MLNKKIRLKKLLSDNVVEELFERIEETLNLNSEAFNEFVLLKGRFQYLSKQMGRNTLYHNEVEVELNKIRASLLSFIDKLSLEDFSDETEQFSLKKEDFFDIKVINERIELLSNENLNVKFDNAPDGLLRIINIDNSNEKITNSKFREHTSIFDAIKSIEEQVKVINELKEFIFLKSILKKSKETNIMLGKAIENLIKGSISLAPLRNSILTSKTGKEVVNFTIENEISSYFPKTVLTQVLGEESVLDKINASAKNESNLQKHLVRRTVFFDNDNYQSVGSKGHSLPNSDDILIFEIPNSKRISLELDTNRINLVSFKETEVNDSIINSIKPIIEEDLTFLQPKYKIYSNISSTIPEKTGNLLDISSYEKDLYDVIKSTRNNNDVIVKFSFAKKKVLEGFLSFFDSIAKFHKQGMVHGDISPKNIILTKTGFISIDPLEIEIGKISTALTPNYCAPEQVLKQPLSIQADIYNIGLLLLSFFKGLLFGKLENFLFPINDNQLISALFISSPEILINFNDKFTKKQKSDWVKLIESCIKFDPIDRIKSVEELSEKFKKLVDEFPQTDEYQNVLIDFGKFSFISSGEQSVRIVRLISTNDRNLGYFSST